MRKPDSSDGSEPAPIGSGRLTSLQFVREIVKRGADVNLRLPKGTPRVPNTSSRIDAEGATPFLFAADRSDTALMRLLLELGADPLPNFTRTPLFIAEGYHGRLLRPDRPTIDAVTRLMRAAGLSTEGERPVLVDIYEKPPEPPKPVKPGRGRAAVVSW